MNNRIFFVEDDAAIREMVASCLTDESFTVDTFAAGAAAIRAFSSDPDYALALIDLMLPDVSGIEVLRAIRTASTVPVIILTARDSDADKMIGLNAGADDYVVKPFSLIELVARIRANIRRARVYDGSGENSQIRIRDLTLDLSKHTAALSGTPLSLTRIEYEILALLASHPGQAFSKEQLYAQIWQEPCYGNEHVLNTHMNRLRAKLKAAAGDDVSYIRTLWGIGYRMEE